MTDRRVANQLRRSAARRRPGRTAPPRRRIAARRRPGRATGQPRPARARTLIPIVVGTVLLPALAAAGCARADATPQPVAAGYLAPWERGSTAELARPPAELNELSPVWYQPTDTGGLAFASDDARAQATGTVRPPATVRLLPSVSNFRAGRWDAGLVGRIVTDPQRRAKHVDALVAAARRPGISGIDIDYESLDPADRGAFSAFVRELAGALHAANRRLSVAVQARTTGGGAGDAQDWQAIGRAADEVRVMAYDHAWAGSPPGPVAPLPWVREVVRYAVTQVRPPKIMLGVPTYGYDWPRDGTGRDVSWAEATALAASRNATVRWDGRDASPWFGYTDGDVAHTVWFDDARSVEAKLGLVREFELGGVAVWQIGGTDPATWQHLRHL